MSITIREKQDALKLLKKDRQMYLLLSDDSKKDKAIIDYMICDNSDMYKYLHDDCKNNIDLSLYILKCNPHCYEFFNKEIKNNKDIMLSYVKISQSIDYLSEEIKNDKDIMLNIIKMYPSLFPRLEQNLKNDKDILIEALSHDGRLLAHSDKYKDDLEMLELAIRKNNFTALKYVDVKNIKNTDFLMKLLNIYESQMGLDVLFDKLGGNEPNLQTNIVKVYVNILCNDDIQKICKKYYNHNNMSYYLERGINLIREFYSHLKANELESSVGTVNNKQEKKLKF
jgi:hypothetical protein